MARQQIVPPAMAGLIESKAYSPAVRAGDFLFVAGQVGRDQQMRPVTGDLTAHIRAAFENLVLVLTEAGATLRDVVELTTYHVGLDEQLATFMEVKREYFDDAESLPTWTAVGVAALTSPDFVVEIQATAYVSSRG